MSGATRRVLADWDERGIVVYQAFQPRTVRAAVDKGTFGVGFGRERMTWIKPSLGWMLHRSGYAGKPRQEAIARVRLSHAGFRSILARAVLTHHDPAQFASEGAWKDALARSEVRCQWDPDRDLYGRPLARRAVQLGLCGATVHRYVDEWVLGVEDVTDLARVIGEAVRGRSPLPDFPAETEYPVDADIARRLGYD